MELKVGEKPRLGSNLPRRPDQRDQELPCVGAHLVLNRHQSGSMPPAISVTSTLPISLMVPVAVFPELGRRLKKALLVLETRRPEVGRVLQRGASLPYRSIGTFEKKFAEILEDSEFVRHVSIHGAVGSVFCDATNQELPKSSCAKPRYRPGTSMDCK
jgi:hypothetical protein